MGQKCIRYRQGNGHAEQGYFYEFEIGGKVLTNVGGGCKHARSAKFQQKALKDRKK